MLTANDHRLVITHKRDPYEIGKLSHVTALYCKIWVLYYPELQMNKTCTLIGVTILRKLIKHQFSAKKKTKMSTVLQLHITFQKCVQTLFKIWPHIHLHLQVLVKVQYHSI
jgi:hypothetical protein